MWWARTARSVALASTLSGILAVDLTAAFYYWAMHTRFTPRG
jgi:hypothetical protein